MIARGSVLGRTRPELIRSLANLAGPRPSAELCTVLGLPRPPAPDVRTDVLVLEAHPYASVHLGAEGMIGGEAGDRVAGFWRTVGLVPPPDADELRALLGLYARLGDEEGVVTERRRLAIESARSALLWEHLVSWVPVFLGSVQRLGEGFYREWAVLLGEALVAEVDGLPARAELPTALAQAPDLLDVGSPKELIDGVLAPVRSGMVVTRADLVAAGRDLGVGLRKGERRYTLGAMLEQEPRGTVGWLAGLAGEWAELHPRLHPGALGRVGEWWADRARATSRLLAGAAGRTLAPS